MDPVLDYLRRIKYPFKFEYCYFDKSQQRKSYNVFSHKFLLSDVNKHNAPWESLGAVCHFVNAGMMERHIAGCFQP